MGTSDRAYGSLALPFDLSPLGPTGCSLHTNIVGTLLRPVDTLGVAGVTLPLPSISPPSLFPTFYFQWLHICPGANPANLVATEGGRLERG